MREPRSSSGKLLELLWLELVVGGKVCNEKDATSISGSLSAFSEKEFRDRAPVPAAGKKPLRKLPCSLIFAAPNDFFCRICFAFRCSARLKYLFAHRWRSIPHEMRSDARSRFIGHECCWIVQKEPTRNSIRALIFIEIRTESSFFCLIYFEQKVNV